MARGTNIYMDKTSAGIVRMEAAQLGYSSPAELINSLISLRKAMCWSKLDIAILTEYKRLPETIILTEAELKEKGYVKVEEFTEKGPRVVVDVAKPFKQTIPIKIKVVKKKQKKPKKKQEGIPYFKGIPKPKGKEL